MRRVTFSVFIATLLSPWAAYACSGPYDERAFDTVAPTAEHIVAVQVESLGLETNGTVQGYGHSFRGKLRVLKHFRGSGQFLALKFVNTRCAGLRIEVGGIYLIATRSPTQTIELNPTAAPILPLSGFPFDPELVLRHSDTVKRLEAALLGDSSFAITTEAARQKMSTFDPPPPVPPP
jgi:hypothetical protein